jgi:hypothetical protein
MEPIQNTPLLYPVGIQDFAKIRRGNLTYVDKTELIYQLTRTENYIFLSRPRRFGKSLLCSTMKYYFEGRRDLFQGLAIDRLEQEWTVYPVIHISLGSVKDIAISELPRRLCSLLRFYEKSYGQLAGKDPGECLMELIHTAYEQTGKGVALIIDEYDAPLLSVLHKPEILNDVREIMQEFYSPLKDLDPYLRFCFITGVTKFSQLSIFSTINNLRNISMLDQYSAICGITERELHQTLEPGVVALSQKLSCTVDECYAKLKEQYDGYHFAKVSEDIYNPFSLLRALDDQDVLAYWFDTGTPSYLVHVLQQYDTDLSQVDGMTAAASQFDVPTERMDSALPLLYQSGYLTIKGYDAELNDYTLGIPNKEVRVGLSQCLLPIVSGTDASSWTGIQRAFCRALLKDDLEDALVALRSYFASIPYPEGGAKFLKKAQTAEWHYANLFFLLFSFMNRSIHTEVKSAIGRADMVMYTARAIYVFEFKVNRPAEEALQQIDEKGYMVPYEADSRKLVKCGVNFSSKTRTLEEWKVVAARR